MGDQSSFEFLALFTCLIIDLPKEGSGKGQDCSRNNSTVCIKCEQDGGFLTGEAVSDFGGVGHIISFVIWILNLYIGTCGILSNAVIVIILKRRVNERFKQFDFLVSFLAIFDMISCICGILAGTSLIACFEGWLARGEANAAYFIHCSHMAFYFSRSLSTHMTTCINIFSYLGIAYPLRARNWFTWKKVKLIPIFVILIATLINIPRVMDSYVAKRYHNDIPSLPDIEYISLLRMHWWSFWYETMFTIHEQLDFLVPLPTLLVFNFLSYRKMRQLQKSRDFLNSTQSNAVQPVKMFLPVVSFLLFCNCGAMVAYAIVYVKGIMYRELFMACLLWNALNCSANFIIYFCRGKAFRDDVKNFFNTMVRFLIKRDVDINTDQ